MERIADEIVDDVRPVERGRVDVMDTAVDSFALDGKSLITVRQRPEDAGRR